MKFLESIGENLDRVIGILSPETAVKRARARLAGQNATRYYDGATGGRRADGWNKMDRGPKENLRDLKTLRDRSRDFGRNNAYARKAMDGIVANTIGTGIVGQYKAEQSAKRRTEQGNVQWKKWFETTACDYDGLSNGYALQALIFLTMVESGEVFIRLRRMSSEYVRKTGNLPIKIQVLEPEFLTSSEDTYALEPGNQIISGIEFNSKGERVAYHMYQQHPSISSWNDTVRVPASEVIHLYKKSRPGMLRGVPWGASTFLNLRDLDVYEDAELTRRKTAACFVGYVQRPLDDDMISVNGNQTTAVQSAIADHLEPGIIETMNPGESITFSTPPNVTGYDEYAVSVLHKIACGWGVPYSVLTGDFRQTSFSSGRMGWLEFNRVIEQNRWNLFIPVCLERVRGWFEDAMDLMDMPMTGIGHEWTCPKREMIDPLKEITATTMQIKAGLITMPEAIKEMGYDPDTTISGIKDWNSKLDAAKIVLDSDPRQDPKRLLAEATAQNVAQKAKIKDTVDKQSGNKNAN